LTAKRQLSVCISQSSLHSNKEDKWLWRDPPSYSFSVKSAYTKLVNHDAGGISKSFFVLWSLKVTTPLFGGIFSNKIATKQNLFKMGVILRDTLCALCGREEETTSHNLITCIVSNVVWKLCNSWLGISLVNHNVLINHFEQSRLFLIKQKVDAQKILFMTQVQSWTWMKHKVRKDIFSFSDWLLSPLICINMATK